MGRGKTTVVSVGGGGKCRQIERDGRCRCVALRASNVDSVETVGDGDVHKEKHLARYSRSNLKSQTLEAVQQFEMAICCRRRAAK